ncbi:MAG: PASTA domain-containing protein [Clostridia bacterium]|nr:PASTA domain-containing protein [Clostridia bacterium]
MSQIDRKADRHTRRRIMFMMAVFCVLCASAVIIRLAFLQIINQDFYEQKALSSQTRDITVYPTRGTIYDTNGKPLAISASTEMLILNPRQLTPKASAELTEEERALLGLETNKKYDLTDAQKNTVREYRIRLMGEELPALLEDVTGEDIVAKAGKDSAYQVLMRGVEKDQADVIRQFISENGLKGPLYFAGDSTRYYPYGSFLAHVLGCVGADEQGLTGLEKKYDDILTGTAGRAVTLTDARGNALTEDYELYYPAEEGQSLVLTIDEVLQHFLEKNLEIAYNDNDVQGSAIGLVMDVNDGGILAMASYPDFDPNDPFTLAEDVQAEIDAIADEEKRAAARSEAVYAQWSNKPVSFLYYPGSTFKIITTAAALEEGLVSVNSTFNCNGSLKVDGWDRPISCWKRQGHGHQTLAEVLQNSCNPAIMNIGFSLGQKTFTEYVEAFGLRDKTGVELTGEAVGLYNMKSNVDLAVYSFGQNFSLTPLQMITAVSAVANGGTLLEPHIVKEVLNADGTVAESHQRTEVRQVISAETSELMKDMLESVVKVGTGKNAYIAGYRVAGKTGTTENIERKNKDKEDVYVTSFVAFAPADNPQIAVLILLDEPTVGNISGGINTAPVVRRFLEEALPYLDIDPIYTEEEQSAKSVVMPDLTGMSFSEAEAALKKLGLACMSQGSDAKVTDQVPAPNATVSGNTKAVLYLGGTKPDKQITVPDLTKHSLSQAKTTLQNLGLYIRVAGGVSEGTQTVTKQDVAAQTQVPYGTVITVETTDTSQQSH